MLLLKQRVVDGIRIALVVQEAVYGRERPPTVVANPLLDLGARLNRQSHGMPDRSPSKT
jgi:hypothetical protein